MSEASPEAEAPRDDAEVISPSVERFDITIGAGDLKEVWTQKPLSFFGKIELFSILGSAVDKAMREGGVSISELLDVPDGDVGSLREADAFVRGIAKLSSYVPELLENLFCVALSIPRDEREHAKWLMSQSVDEGGLSDDVAFKVIENFIDQNWEVIRGFFSERIEPLIAKITKGQTSESSKPSSPTPRRTRRK